MAGGLAAQYQGKVTVLMLDEKPMDNDDSVRRMDVLSTCAIPTWALVGMRASRLNAVNPEPLGSIRG